MSAITLYPYQKRWLADRGRFKIGMFARQTGKTFTNTLECVDDCMDAEAAGRKARWVILSRGERQAKEAMEEGVTKHLKAYQVAFDAYEFDWDPKTKAQEVRLPGGSRITALPANPDTARGYSANVLLDEFAFHKDSRAIWQALFPVISAGYKLRVVSTPNGKGNKFYDLMTGKEGVWSRHVVDIYQAVAEGLPRNIEELRAGIDDEDAWAQEYELQWLDEASAWLSFDLINGVEDGLAGIPDLYAGGPCFAGVDIGRRKDLFAIWVDELLGDVKWCREIVIAKNARFAEQDALLADAFARYRIMRLCMDQTGMGEKPVEDAQRLYGETRVEGVLFTAPNKLALATIGKKEFEDRKLRIPEGNPLLRKHLHALKKIPSPTGTPRFDADSDSSGHADLAWAKFLAANAAAGPVMEYGYEAVRVPRGRTDDEAGDRIERPVRCTAGFRAHGGLL